MTEKELWVQWTQDAMHGYESPEDADDIDAAVDDMVNLVTQYADAMLDEYNDRFGGTSKKKRRKKRSDRREDDEDS